MHAIARALAPMSTLPSAPPPGALVVVQGVVHTTGIPPPNNNKCCRLPAADHLDLQHRRPRARSLRAYTAFFSSLTKLTNYLF
jgi:hypothetical protein